MTREEAIEILWQYDVNFEPHPAEKVMHAIDMAIEALQREEAEEKGYCHRIKPKEYFSTDAEWIPCSERLPGENETVLISAKYIGHLSKNSPYVEEGFLTCDGWYSAYGDNYSELLAEVVAWMPLPEPYKGGDDE